jgi:hypothetical protein
VWREGKVLGLTTFRSGAITVRGHYGQGPITVTPSFQRIRGRRILEFSRSTEDSALASRIVYTYQSEEMAIELQACHKTRRLLLFSSCPSIQIRGMSLSPEEREPSFSTTVIQKGRWARLLRRMRLSCNNNSCREHQTLVTYRYNFRGIENVVHPPYEESAATTTSCGLAARERSDYLPGS